MELAFKALGDTRRLGILRLVWEQEMAASEIAGHFPEVSRPAISQQLGVLRRAELVCERREGTRRLYRANHVELRSLRDFLDGYWTESLGNLRDLVEQATDNQRRQ
jgi:DNA-binding transcriptional ArsR family regulator